ncbi:hypothetical protein TNCV_2926991 [Trichonephila clavipes]|nr:hypothetical protein TNCV_2926991 [Trichonephila clavipes]
MCVEWSSTKTLSCSMGSTKTPSSAWDSTKAPSSTRGSTKTPSSSKGSIDSDNLMFFPLHITVIYPNKRIMGKIMSGCLVIEASKSIKETKALSIP